MGERVAGVAAFICSDVHQISRGWQNISLYDVYMIFSYLYPIRIEVSMIFRVQPCVCTTNRFVNIVRSFHFSPLQENS